MQSKFLIFGLLAARFTRFLQWRDLFSQQRSYYTEIFFCITCKSACEIFGLPAITLPEVK